MNIIVCIKQVPDTKELRINPQTGSLVREGVPSIINPDDRHAVEEAVRIKEKHGGKVTAITMGPQQAVEILRECLAMGADEAILLTDKAFSGADTWATSYTLGCAIRKIEKFDLIVCGRQAIDGNTAQVGPQLAEFLGLTQITYVQVLEYQGETLKLQRALEDGYEVVETKLPALLTVIKDINIPRIPALDMVLDAYTKEIVIWAANDLPVEKNMIGLKGSPTTIRKIYTPAYKRSQVEIINGPLEEAVQTLLARIKNRYSI